MVNSPEVSWAPPPSPLPSPLGSPLPEAGIPASPRRPGFRERLVDLAAEYEELQARCETLAADNRDLREKLAAVQSGAEGGRVRDSLVPLPSAVAYSTDQDKEGDGRDALAIEDNGGKGSREDRKGRDDRDDRDDHDAREARKAEGSGRLDSYRTVDHCAERSYGKPSDGGGAANRGNARGSGDGGPGAASGDEESGSSSSSGSEGSHGHHRRRRKHRRRHSHGHRRRRRHASRSRSARSRSRRGKRPPSPPRREGALVARGLYGSGDHRRDIEDFCMKNQLEARVISALKSMPESKQRKVMGTDGGENSYLLIDRVKNPNAVVMSRIRKIEAEM